MKKITHKINVVLSILWTITSVSVLIFALPYEDNNFVIAILGFVSLVMSSVTLIYGAIIPDKDIYLSDKQSKFAMILVALNGLLNKSATPSSSVDVLNGEKPFRRNWIPIMYLILIIIEGPISVVAFFTDNIYLKYSTISMLVVMLLLLISSSIWFVEYCKEMYDGNPLKPLLLQYIIVLVIFGIGLIGSYIIHKDDNKSYIDVDKIQSDLDNAKEALYDMDSADLFNKKEYETITDVFLMICSSFNNQKVYYHLQEKSEYKFNIIVWTDIENDVYIYQFTKENDKYIRQNVFKSEKIKKEDVQGKETGIIEP